MTLPVFTKNRLSNAVITSITVMRFTDFRIFVIGTFETSENARINMSVTAYPK